MQYAVASPGFDHAVEDRAESARTNFVVFSAVLSALGTAAGWVVWLRWRRRADVDGQPDGPARLLAMGVTTLPQDRHEWGEALSAELASIDDRGERWRFAASGARARLSVHPRGGNASGGMGRCRDRRGRGDGVRTPPRSTCLPSTPVSLLSRRAMWWSRWWPCSPRCLVLLVAAPTALTSKPTRPSRRCVPRIGDGCGAVGDVVVGDPGRRGALTIIGPAQLVAYVVAPAVVAAITRSLQAAMQCIVWGFVFSASSNDAPRLHHRVDRPLP